MGTHPIFESDFDCLTDGLNELFPRLGVVFCDTCLRALYFFALLLLEVADGRSNAATGTPRADPTQTFLFRRRYRIFLWMVQVRCITILVGRSQLGHAPNSSNFGNGRDGRRA